MYDQLVHSVSRKSFLNIAFRIGGTVLIASPGIVVAAKLIHQESATSLGRLNPDVGFSGTVTDLATLLPLPGAVITTEPEGASGVSDQDGKYSITLPPGRYSVEFSAPGYITATFLNQVIDSFSANLDSQLFLSNPSAEQQTLLYARAVRQFVSPLVDQASTDRIAAMGVQTTIPTTITVNYDAATGANPPYQVNVPLEDYVKGVVPNEVPASWPAHTLQAQAVAARTYGVASQLANGFVYPDTRSQVYNPNARYSTTDAATDATAGVVLTVNGSVIFAYFFSTCSGVTTRDSENLNLYVTDSHDNIVHNGVGQAECASCASKGACWNYVSYCRARSCTGHAPYAYSDCGYWGHGVGMCQWGAYYRGNLNYTDILYSYYTGVSLTTASVSTPTQTPTRTPTKTPTPTSTPTRTPTRTPTPTPTPIPTPRPTGPFLIRSGDPATLTWQSVGNGASYDATLTQPGLPVRVLSTTSGTSWNVGVLELGAWTFMVEASNHTSASATLNVVKTIFREDAPRVSN